MASIDFDVEIKQLQATMKTIGQVLDLDGMRAEIADLGEQVAAPDLWDDQANAHPRHRPAVRRSRAELDRFTELDGRIDDVEIMVELAAGGGRRRRRWPRPRPSCGKIHKAVEHLEVRTLLSGEYDEREAIISDPLRRRWRRRGGLRRDADADVHALGRAQQVPRRGLRHVLRRGGRPEVRDLRDPRALRLRHALSVEAGTHRLVRISPFDNQGRRQTSFAAVEVVPVLEQTDEIEIPDEDIRVDVYRSGGPGGQSVNTTDSAVRLTHIPTGTVVSCQNEKSQLQNKASAMVILKAKLLALKKAEEKAQLDALRGDVQASWGDQMRNYVLNPYQMVKDLRTDYEVGNPQAVFDGDIDGFLEAGIRWRMGAEKAAAN